MRRDALDPTLICSVSCSSTWTLYVILMGEAMFLFIASLIFCHFTILPFNRSWLLEKDRMLVEKRTIVYLSVAMTWYHFLRFLLLTEFRILNSTYCGYPPLGWMHLINNIWSLFAARVGVIFQGLCLQSCPKSWWGASVPSWDRPFSTEPLIRSSSICTCVINKWIVHNWNMNVNVYCII
jgi:hypothetical protein